jgi:hypothetical protein
VLAWPKRGAVGRVAFLICCARRTMIVGTVTCCDHCVCLIQCICSLPIGMQLSTATASTYTSNLKCSAHDSQDWIPSITAC